MLSKEALAAFDAAFAEDITRAEAGLQGRFGAALDELLTLSNSSTAAEDILKFPNADYSRLITLVESASASNLSNAQLKDRIVALGDSAVSIAKKVSRLAPLFVP